YKSATQSGITNISYHFELPIIATNVGGLAETILHEQTGLIVDEVSETAIAKQIQSYFENYNPIEFSKNIRQINEENSWENFVSKLLDFAKDLR
ncbi:MAG: glycosyltransferase, partial [Flavobacteriales bacterium]|nr:glycosyltransferase [Flavobacteriales bacterium]